MSRAYVALGGNIEGPACRLLAVMGEFGAVPDTRLVRASSLYRTAPVGYSDQPDFINAIVLLETGLSPHALMAELLSMETRHGRVRHLRNGPRTLDLDLLLYEDVVLDGDPALILPHPRLHERAFVLVPLLEVEPNCVLPLHGPASAILQRLASSEDIRRIEYPGLDDGLQVLRRLALGLTPVVRAESSASCSASRP